MKKRIMLACLLGCLAFTAACNGQGNAQKNDEVVNSTEIIEETDEQETRNAENTEEVLIEVSDAVIFNSESNDKHFNSCPSINPVL